MSVRFAEGTGANLVHAMTPQRLSGGAGEFTIMMNVNPRDFGDDPQFPDPLLRPLLSKHTLGTHDGGWEAYLEDDLDNPGSQKVVFRAYPVGGNTPGTFTTNFTGTDNDLIFSSDINPSTNPFARNDTANSISIQFLTPPIGTPPMTPESTASESRSWTRSSPATSGT